MIITVSGLAGTGTTSVCQRLKEILGYEYIYAGAIFREEARKMDMPIEEFCHYLEENPQMDKTIDKKVIEFARSYPNTILEGRLAGWMVHLDKLPALKVLLKVPLNISAKRVALRDLSTYEEAMDRVQKRDFRDQERYKKLYNVDLNDESIYDLIIDTSERTVEEEVALIMEYMNNYCNS